MKTIRNIYLLVLLLCLGFDASAQQGTTTLTPGYWTFGLNAGLAYQSSDIKSKLDGFGFGATLGKNIFYQPGAPLAFDLRGRFLYTRQYGLDVLRDYNIAKNPTLNGTELLDYTTYPIDLNEPRGFVFQNNQTTTAELGLEGLITLNQLRERTGFHVGLYGGIGLDWFKTKTDQADASGKEYFEGYANIKESSSNSAIRNELERLLDGTYETVADGNKESGTLKFMPSLGIELGYQLSPHFLIYAGHRVTFSGTDALDGQRFANPNNDLYHYTSLGLRWTIEPAREKPIARVPEIELVSPLGSPYTTNMANGLVIANIRYINSAADVDCIVNSRSVPFDYRDGHFSIDTPLNPGSNDITIVAKNEYGQDRKTVIIVYRDQIVTNPPPRVEAPRVRFTNPATSSARTEDPDFDTRASIDNVSDRRDVTFVVNGVERDFVFENGTLRSNISLREGDNQVQIRARNSAGTDAAEVTIIREVRIPLPRVKIVDPSGNRVESRYQNARVTAQVSNVESKSDISMTLNGRNVWNFDFDQNKGYVIADVTLENGANTVVIIAQNRAGDARDEVTILYQEPLPEPKYPPTVRITEPARTTSTTTQAVVQIEAVITNISNRNDISFVVNGARRNDFNFDTRNGRLTANVSLLVGNNDIAIRATNRDGEDQQNVSIRRIDEVVISRPPVIRINAPTNNSETANAYADVRASIDNVDGKNQIDLIVNGRSVSNFNFNRGQFSASVPLVEGNNTIRIRATNRDGNDDETVNVRYRKMPLPVVQITAPSNNSETSNASVQVRARVDNVDNQSQIRLILNGRNTNFNLDRNGRDITANVNLIEGNNTIRIEAQTNAGNASDQVNVRYHRAMPPTVSISAPNNNSTTESANVTLRARLSNVNNRNQVSIKLNGAAISNFSLSGSDLSANIVLREGNNTITVRVSNDDGSDEASVNVRYQPLQKPVVKITDPASSPFIISQNNYLVKASLQNVDSKNEITVQVNRSNYTLFNFDNKSGEVAIRAVNLNEGDNTILIRASNRGGSAEASVTLRYSLPKPPTVSITAPADGSTTELNKVPVKAVITNVNSQRAVTFKVNGAVVNVFDLKGKEFAATAALRAGENTITISAQNEDGRAEASAKIYFQLKQTQLLTPNIRFVQPSKPGIVVKEESYNIKATVINVSSANELTMWVNDKESKDFQFSAKNKQLTAAIPLNVGKNTIRIKAQNKGGTHEAETNIVYQAADAPVITIESISQPTVNPFRPKEGSSTIIAQIENVSGKENVKVLVNDVEIDDFSYDITSNRIKATVQLKKGSNSIVIRANNDAGSVEESRTIEF